MSLVPVVDEFVNLEEGFYFLQSEADLHLQVNYLIE